ncbi:NifX-associated nitrogen fixation protein [Mesorhizobium sp. M0189]|uniref:NifX-associated nitrogen fixation protein n=1 Tax=Mesorhizobium sp. M0189 TaxID=2956909 RepID=UPI0033360319
MSGTAISPAVNEDEAALATPFVRCLVRLIRAQDSYGSWEGEADAELLADFIVTRKQRRAMPVIGNPEPDVLWRLDMFYTAVGLAIEERFGLMTSPMTKMNPMGASDHCVSRPGGWSLCPDIHRFGFETFRKLAEAGTKLVDDATAAIEAYPGGARA